MNAIPLWHIALVLGAVAAIGLGLERWRRAREARRRQERQAAAFGERNEDRVGDYTDKLNALRERLQEIAEYRIAKLFIGHRVTTPQDYFAAVARAHRVIAGGGDLAAAVYQGIKPMLDEAKT